jgi:hypothetical protein
MFITRFIILNAENVPIQIDMELDKTTRDNLSRVHVTNVIIKHIHKINSVGVDLSKLTHGDAKIDEGIRQNKKIIEVNDNDNRKA